MANDDYSTSVHSSENHSAVYNSSNTLAGSVRLYVQNSSNSNVDGQEIGVQICGDLA